MGQLNRPVTLTVEQFCLKWVGVGVAFVPVKPKAIYCVDASDYGKAVAQERI